MEPGRVRQGRGPGGGERRGVRKGAAPQNDLSPVYFPLWASVSPFLAWSGVRHSRPRERTATSWRTPGSPANSSPAEEPVARGAGADHPDEAGTHTVSVPPSRARTKPFLMSRYNEPGSSVRLTARSNQKPHEPLQVRGGLAPGAARSGCTGPGGGYGGGEDSGTCARTHLGFVPSASILLPGGLLGMGLPCLCLVSSLCKMELASFPPSGTEGCGIMHG